MSDIYDVEDNDPNGGIKAVIYVIFAIVLLIVAQLLYEFFPALFSN